MEEMWWILILVFLGSTAGGESVESCVEHWNSEDEFTEFYNMDQVMVSSYHSNNVPFKYYDCIEEVIRNTERIPRSDNMDLALDTKPFFSLGEMRDPRILTNRYKLPPYTNVKVKAGREFLAAYNSLEPVITLVDFTKESRRNAADFLKILPNLHPRGKDINFELMFFNSSGNCVVLGS